MERRMRVARVGLLRRERIPNLTLTFTAQRDTTVAEVNQIVKAAAEGPLKGILQYNEDPVVSSDMIGNPHSSIFDAPWTMVMSGNMIKVLSWYDNEAGFSNRMVDLTRFVVAKGL